MDTVYCDGPMVIGTNGTMNVNGYCDGQHVVDDYFIDNDYECFYCHDDAVVAAADDDHRDDEEDTVNDEYRTSKSTNERIDVPFLWFKNEVLPEVRVPIFEGVEVKRLFATIHGWW